MDISLFPTKISVSADLTMTVCEKIFAKTGVFLKKALSFL